MNGESRPIWGNYAASLRDFCYADGRLSIRPTALLSIGLSLLLIAFDPVFNYDGILYLWAARAYLGLAPGAVVDIYNWPSFSVLIALIHKAIPLPLHQIALLVVSAGYLLGAHAFVRLVEEMGASRRAQLFALLIFCCHPMISAYRGNIVRDPLLWAFMLLALRELIRYSKKPCFPHQAKWTLYAAAACFFRVEGLIIALTAPLALLFVGGADLSSRCKGAFRILLPPVLLLTMAIAVLLTASQGEAGKLKVFVDFEYYLAFLANIRDHFAQQSEILSDAWLAHKTTEDSGYAMFAALLALCVLNVVRAITPIYTLALLRGLFGQARLVTCKHANSIIAVHLVVISTYLLMFMLGRQFGLVRHSLQFAIIALLYLPFVVDGFWRHKTRRRLVRILLAVTLAGYGLDTVVNGDYRKAYIHEAAMWLKNETPARTQVVSNHSHIAYFSEKQGFDFNKPIRPAKPEAAIWRPGVTYAYQADADGVEALRARILEAGGTIRKVFGEVEEGVVIIFTIAGPEPRAASGAVEHPLEALGFAALGVDDDGHHQPPIPVHLQGALHLAGARFVVGCQFPA